MADRDRGEFRDFRAERTQGVQLSEFWPHKLPDGSPVQVWIIADQAHLNQAAYRLNFLGREAVAAVDFQGVDLEHGGKLSLCFIVFNDGCLNCFVFDLLQLGESFTALMPFLQNNTVSKLLFDVPTHAKLCAQQFGITLAGVFHAQSAYQLLVGNKADSLIELLEWCGVAPAQARAEATMMERAPGLWAHRPLAKETLINGVHSISFLHKAGRVLWTRLCQHGGQSSASAVTQASQQFVQEAAAQGWQLRQAGVEAGSGAQYDPELDSWLARRFGKGSGDREEKPSGDVARPGDSPRTASWRATMAQMQPARSKSRGPSPGRQRSESPSLDHWIQARNEAKGTEELCASQPKGPTRSTSLPPTKSDFIQVASDFKEPPGAMREALEKLNLSFEQLESLKADGRTWADILEEANEEEKDADADLFTALQQAERRRLAQAELS